MPSRFGSKSLSASSSGHKASVVHIFATEARRHGDEWVGGLREICLYPTGMELSSFLWVLAPLTGVFPD